jgi:hypothetical protein
VRRESERCIRAWSRAGQESFTPPESLCGFRRWFLEHEQIFQGSAVLIVHGAVARRRGAFAAYMPVFHEGHRGWTLVFDRLRVEFAPGRMLSIGLDRLPLTASGHALERMFQRRETLDWSQVREALSDALLISCAAGEAFDEKRFRQCALPAGDGLLVGRVHGERLLLKTFLPGQDLAPRWAALLADYRALLNAYPETFGLAAACGHDLVTDEIRACLARPRHAWLRMAYVPGQDPCKAAWAAR